MTQQNNTDISLEMIAIPLAVLAMAARMAWEIKYTLVKLGVDGGFWDLTFEAQKNLLLNGVLRPSLLIQFVVWLPLFYLPLLLLMTGINGLSSPGTDLTGGSIAQKELD